MNFSFFPRWRSGFLHVHNPGQFNNFSSFTIRVHGVCLYDEVQNHAAERELNFGELLGAAMVHELGHLLPGLVRA
jgi:hypothetical protein